MVTQSVLVASIDKNGNAVYKVEEEITLFEFKDGSRIVVYVEESPAPNAQPRRVEEGALDVGQRNYNKWQNIT